MAAKHKANKSEASPATPKAVVSATKVASESVDKLIHEPVRLGLLCALAGVERLSFVELKRLLSTTDGNLSVHLRRLEEAAYIDCEKGFRGRIPHTTYRLTDAGRAALMTYVNHMEALVRHANRVVRAR
ncbi:transcriptional regulator [Chloracidobacterium validum]|uniref:Transcriptional regulator n=1 Tax=Chloracidobacterium validum TaxID=2821543 RepID=A0ABX8BDA0_9BACT|nr:transcriptional regulator [Chloracidobacterium validum]QUW04669.1 transcriptional regulator [Chloracidobacterium validum]